MNTQSPIEVVLERLEGIKDHVNYYMALCPAHPEKTPSLQVTETEEGVVLLNCFGASNCTVERIVESIGLTMRDLFPHHEDIDHRLSAVEREQYRQAIELQWVKRRQEKLEKRLSLLEEMSHCTDHETYYRNLDTPEGLQAVEYWMGEGMELDTIDRYRLGYCHHCPTDREGHESFTLPVINGGKLRNIRHRLNVTGGDKYRPHRKGLPATLFNADTIKHAYDWLLLVEGEKKSIILEQAGIPNVGVMGANAFNPAWVSRIKHVKRIYVGYDPDAQEASQRDATLFGERGRVVFWPIKPDDMITHYHATADDLMHYINLARPI